MFFPCSTLSAFCFTSKDSAQKESPHTPHCGEGCPSSQVLQTRLFNEIRSVLDTEFLLTGKCAKPLDHALHPCSTILMQG